MAVMGLAQSGEIIVPSQVRLPKDSVLKSQLLASLKGFMENKEKPVAENPFVLAKDLLETAALLDEMRDVEKDEDLKDDHFYKCYLTNAIRYNDSTFTIQLAHIGIKDNVPVPKANFTILAKRQGGRFYFRSPLKQYTASWTRTPIGAMNIYHKGAINMLNAGKYVQLVSAFDEKLGTPILPTDYYCCDNFREALQVTGIDYKSDYNAYRYNSLSEKENSRHLNVNGAFTAEFNDIDPHDLWHSRLHKVLPVAVINKPVDEGSAYLYGGSWGFTWDQILAKFKEYAAKNPNADWITEYNESRNFDEKGQYPLNVDMAINALIIKKIEHDKGFAAVLQLLACGPKEKDNANYFSALEKITGISRSHFNKEVWALIKAS